MHLVSKAFSGIFQPWYSFCYSHHVICFFIVIMSSSSTVKLISSAQQEMEEEVVIEYIGSTIGKGVTIWRYKDSF